MLRRKPSKVIACKTTLAWFRLSNGKLSQLGSYFDWFLNAAGLVLRDNVLSVADKSESGSHFFYVVPSFDSQADADYYRH